VFITGVGRFILVQCISRCPVICNSSRANYQVAVQLFGEIFASITFLFSFCLLGLLRKLPVNYLEITINIR